ncbi:MAG: sugar phosphate isomerase/epimerase [Patescibacteria group bacterium]|jgi:sugar phosphate isomerase/epimerase
MEGRHKRLCLNINALKKCCPGVGIGIFRMPLDEAIDIFNTAGIPMQFKPKSISDMKKINAGIKYFGSPATLHLPNLRYEENGLMQRKDELIRIVKEKTPSNIRLVTVHLGWKDADLVLDKKGNWKNTEEGKNVKNDLFELFIAGIKSGKTITIENLHYKPYKHFFRELLSSRPEHLIKTRNMIAKNAARSTGWPLKKILRQTGFTLDVGHASANAHLNKKYPLSAWLKTLGADIKIIHLHDMQIQIQNGMKVEQAHIPMGSGVVDWKNFFKLKKKHCPDAPMIIELPEEDAIKSIEFLRK